MDHARKREQGFSLIEMMIAIAIFSLLTMGAMTLFATSNTAFYRGQSRVDAQQNARTAIEAMTREIRMAGFDGSTTMQNLPNPTPIQAATATSITFVYDLTADGTLDQVSYQVSGTTLTRSTSTWNGTAFPAATSGEIADGMSQLTFAYFDASNATIGFPITAGTLANIERITVSVLTTDTTSGNTQTFPLVEDVRLRN